MQPQLKLSIKKITQLRNAVVLCISTDLPFAQQRFCAVEGIQNIEMLSTFRNSDFSEHYGVGITSDALAGLNARAILV